MSQGVCFVDGWHYSTKLDEAGNEVPDQKLVLGDDGEYRPVTDDDVESWNDRKHQRFVTVEMEDGTGIRVTPEEMFEVQRLLSELRSG